LLRRYEGFDDPSGTQARTVHTRVAKLSKGLEVIKGEVTLTPGIAGETPAKEYLSVQLRHATGFVARLDIWTI
jgi:hypothetical protein